ncbi:MAG TPA: response regulator [Acidobacteriaceae bacterium]
MSGDPLKPKVLIVDDEYAIARTLAIILNQSGFRALPIYHAWAALQVAEGLQPDILLTDVVMPGCDGFEIAVKICAKVPRCRVFLLSAQFRAADRVEEFRSRGYRFEFMHKPIHPSDLLTRLRVAVS